MTFSLYSNADVSGWKVIKGGTGGGGTGGGGTNYAQFTPGNYMLLSMAEGVRDNNVITGGHSGYDTALSEIKNRNTMVGLQFRWYWNQVEFEKGVYNYEIFNKPLNDLANTTLSGINKKAMFLFAVTAGTGVGPDAAHVVPPYMLSTTSNKMGPGSDGINYEGGQWGFDGAGSDGYRIRFTNANVLARLKIMLANVGKYIRTHPNYHVFETLAFSESAIGNALAGWTVPDEDVTSENTFEAAMTFDAEVPERMTHLMINYSNSTDAFPGRIDTQIDRCRTNKLGFGSPNVFWDSEPLWRLPNAKGNGEGAMRQMSHYEGARIAQLQGQDQWCTAHPASGNVYVCPAPGHRPTFAEHFDNLTTILDAHYVVIQRENQTDPNNPTQKLYQTMLNFYNTDRPTNTTRPTVWKTY